MIDLSYPVTMKHPQHAPAILNTSAVANNYGALAQQYGAPERFPDVTVHNTQQEEQMRARGYLRIGENMSAASDLIEFPKILMHPDHEEGTPATQASIVVDGVVRIVPVPAKPVKFADVTVHSREEEEKWAAKGYHPAGHYDEKAYERAVDAPGEPGDEYPRWEEDEDGNPILVQDPSLPITDDCRLYPMMVYSPEGKELGVANNAADKEKLLMRGSSKNEPTKRPVIQVPQIDPEQWRQFLAFQAWQAAQAAGATEMIAPEPEPPKSDEDIEDLRNQAQELGVAVDKRWSVKTLKHEIDLALNS